MRTVKTNLGTMPIQDYREIAAVQNGFDSYEDLRRQGCRLGGGYDTEDDLPEETEKNGGNMELEIKVADRDERLYVYSQSCQIAGQTGFVGYLRADMDTDGNGFYSSWNDNTNNPSNKTEEFKEEIDEVINALRFDDFHGGMAFTGDTPRLAIRYQVPSTTASGSNCGKIPSSICCT